MNSASPDNSVLVIPAHSKSQVMDWSLVLASQDISATLIHTEEGGWGLEVEPQDYERALRTIRQYRLENRRWGWRQPIPWSHATFHFGAAAWCALLVLMHWMTTYRAPQLRIQGRFASAAAAHGEWWRAFTAVSLHADLGHLLANTTIGFVVFGLAMARYGAGVGLLAAYLSGAAGNLAGLTFYPKPYFGVGASGMVMGALGLISVPHSGLWVWHPRALKQVTQGLLAGIFLFLLLGVDPASDVIAHAGGYVAGGAIGLALNFLPPSVLESRRVSTTAWVVLVALFVTTWWLALIPH